MVPELPKKDSLRLKSIEVKSSPPEAFDLSDNLGSSDMDTGIAPQKPQCIIHHDAWYYLTWWTIVAVASVISGVLTPIIMAFFPDRANTVELLDILFYIDILMTFFVSIPYHGVSIKSHKEIAIRYLKLWFWADVLSVIPFERFTNVDDYSNFLRLFRLLRLRRFFPLLAVMEKSHLFNYLMVSIFKYFMMASYNAHWSACIFYQLARIHDFDDTTWVFNNAFGLENENAATKYVTSLYWAITTLTTVGYGDISPVNNDERAWVMIYMMINLGMTSYLIGNMTALISKPDSVTAQFREHLDDVSKFMKKTNVPVELRRQVIGFIQLQNQMKLKRGNEAMDALPSAIRVPIRTIQYADIFSEVDIFDGVSEEFTERLLGHLHEEMFMKGMDIICTGDYGSAFYILSSGECEIVCGDNLGQFDRVASAVVKPGGHFGSEGFFASVHQPFTIRVKKTCIAIKIRESFKAELTSLMSQDLRVVITNILKRLRRLAGRIHRGIVLGKENGGTYTKDSVKKDGLPSSNSSDTDKVVNTLPLFTTNGKATQSKVRSLRAQSSNSVGSLGIERKTTLQDVGDKKASIRKGSITDIQSEDDEKQPLSPKVGSMDRSKTLSDSNRRGSDDSLDASLHGTASARGSINSKRHSHLHITKYWFPFFRQAESAGNEVLAFKKSFEHDVAASLCQLAALGDHRGLRVVLKGRDLSEETGDYDRRVPLHLACAKGHLEACKVLIAHRSDPNHADHAGRTPLLEAVEGGHEKIIDFLCRKDIDAQLKLRKAGEYLCDAAWVGNIPLLERLAKAKADINAGDYDKRTALHLAAAEGNLAVCKLLVRVGARPTMMDRWNTSPMDAAKGGNHEHVIEWFQEQMKEMKKTEAKKVVKKEIKDTLARTGLSVGFDIPEEPVNL
ncbi:hypothetical protein AAMO2058_001228400 [Amorphochlora amoebiformis]|mmetsp:Transcript_5925/g.9096  ORF Transcript_5925/g.9096 Transcript_5925/m.9096 type:complete len:902 (-) Transcript_5925:217-2922(-)